MRGNRPESPEYMDTYCDCRECEGVFKAADSVACAWHGLEAQATSYGPDMIPVTVWASWAVMGFVLRRTKPLSLLLKLLQRDLCRPHLYLTRSDCRTTIRDDDTPNSLGFKNFYEMFALDATRHIPTSDSESDGSPDSNNNIPETRPVSVTPIPQTDDEGILYAVKELFPEEDIVYMSDECELFEPTPLSSPSPVYIQPHSL